MILDRYLSILVLNDILISFVFFVVWEIEEGGIYAIRRNYNIEREIRGKIKSRYLLFGYNLYEWNFLILCLL